METITREWLKRPLKAYDKHHVSLSQIWSHSNSLVSNNKPVRPSSDHAQGENTSKTSEASLLSVVYISLQNVMEIYRSIGWKSKASCILNMVTKTTRRFACCLPPATHHSPNLRLLWTLDNILKGHLISKRVGWDHITAGLPIFTGWSEFADLVSQRRPGSSFTSQFLATFTAIYLQTISMFSLGRVWRVFPTNKAFICLKR